MEHAQFLEQLGDALWHALPPGPAFPHQRPLLAHYTSVEVLEKMLTTDELWLSNPLFMNDSEEMRFGMIAGAQKLRESEQIRAAFADEQDHRLLLQKFGELYSKFDAEHVIDTYVLSFSEHEPLDRDGRLSMWRGYGAAGKGVAVVFDSNKIQSLPGSPLTVAKVRYGTAQQRLEWLDVLVGAFAEKLAIHKPSGESLAKAAELWFERLKLFALFTKHDGFREEQEWRIVYFSDRDRENLLRPMVSYAITQRGVEPKLKLSLKSLPAPLQAYSGIEDLVDRILLGPGVANLLSATSILKMLTLRGKPSLCVRVGSSSIPFRPT